MLVMGFVKCIFPLRNCFNEIADARQVVLHLKTFSRPRLLRYRPSFIAESLLFNPS